MNLLFGGQCSDQDNQDNKSKRSSDEQITTRAPEIYVFFAKLEMPKNRIQILKVIEFKGKWDGMLSGRPSNLNRHQIAGETIEALS